MKILLPAFLLLAAHLIGATAPTIPPDELAFHERRLRTEVAGELMREHGVEASPAFWTTPLAGRTPAEVLRERAIREVQDARALQQRALDAGVVDRVLTHADWMAEFDTNLRQREETRTRGGVAYGPATLDPEAGWALWRDRLGRTLASWTSSEPGQVAPSASMARLGEAESRQPDIVLVLVDDLGWGDVGFNGQQHIRTPVLDRLAAEGMVFDQHYAGAPVCMPSRCVLLTGKHLGRATIRGNPRETDTGKPVDLAPGDVTLAEELVRAGYASGVFGKWGLAEASDEGLPTRQGFGTFFGYRRHLEAHHYYPPVLWEQEEAVQIPGNVIATKEGTYAHDMIMDCALAWVAEPRDQPLFLFLTPTIPHFELTVPEDSKAPYRGLGWPERAMKPEHYRHDPEGNITYAAMISRLDRDLGRLLEALAIHRPGRETLFLFTSDNGPEYEKVDGFFNSNGPFRGGKRDLYEGGIRVPLLAWWPSRIPAGVRSPHASAFDDLLPTLCELAGVEPSDPEITGQSMLPSLLGKPSDQKARHHFYWEFKERGKPVQALRRGDWKLVRFVGQAAELYDLASDPGETRDLSGDHPEIVRELEGLLESARTPHPAFSLTLPQK